MIDKEIRDALSAPIPPDEIMWKPQVIRRATSDSPASALMVAYVDARWVAERLDEASNGDWSFSWGKEEQFGDRLVVHAYLHVCGSVREDVGEYQIKEKDDIDPYKSAVSDAFKRSAVMFGVGRELYRMDPHWVKWDERYKRPMDGEMEKLIASLKSDSWTHSSEDVQRFWAWTTKLGVTNKEVLGWLSVSRIEDYRRSKKEAQDAVNAGIAMNTKE